MEMVELSVSDHAELGALERFLRAVVPESEIRRSAGTPGPGEQGALDWVTIVASSSTVATAIRTLPRFLQARKPGLSVDVKVKGTSVSISGANIDEAMRVVDTVLHG